MSDRPTVIEVIVTAALDVEIPIDYGDDLRAGVETVLGDHDAIRHVAIEELGDVTSGNGQLRVEVYARLTVHLEPDTMADATRITRGQLAAAESIAAVRTFDIESGPYRIEAW